MSVGVLKKIITKEEWFLFRIKFIKVENGEESGEKTIEFNTGGRENGAIYTRGEEHQIITVDMIDPIMNMLVASGWYVEEVSLSLRKGEHSQYTLYVGTDTRLTKLMKWVEMCWELF